MNKSVSAHDCRIPSPHLLTAEHPNRLRSAVPCPEDRGGHAPYVFEGIGEVAVICVAEVQGQLRQAARAGREPIGGYPCSQTPDIAAEAQAGSAVERVRQMKWRASEHAGKLRQARQHLEPPTDHKLCGFD